MADKEFDLICIGRSCVDLYCAEFGVPLKRAMTFSKSVGGSPMNIAIGTSRLGLKIGAITGVGAEENGRYLKWQLESEGVDVSAVKEDPKRLTAMVILSIRGPNDYPLIQYRENCADMGLVPDDIDPAYLARAGAVLVTGTHLSRDGVRATTLKILKTAKSLGLKTILDIDYRPNLWGLQGHDAGSSRWAAAAEQCTREFQAVLPYFDLIVGTEEEYFIAGGVTESIAALREVRKRTKALLVFKLGERGCAALPGEIPSAFIDEVIYPGFPVKVYNSIGAGDGFMSGFLRGWLRGEDLATCCRYANAAGAFAVSRLGCSSAYPSWTELSYFLAHGSPCQWLREDAILEQIHWATNRRNKWKNLAILAFDHREGFAELAAAHGKTAQDISTFKKLIFQAVTLAAEDQTVARSNDVGILVDDTYGLDILFESNRHAFWVGRSIEKTGPGPLVFEGQADVGMTLATWPENHVVKCLFRPGAHDGMDTVAENEKQLCRLFSGVRGTGHDLLLEVIVEEAGDEADQLLLYWIRRCYELGVYPDYWKIIPTGKRETWQALEALIEQFDPHCRGILLLGLNASEESLVDGFKVAAGFEKILGFAIGRSIFLKPAQEWFSGTITADEAVSTVKERFLRLVHAWNQNRK